MAATGNGPQRSCGCWVQCNLCREGTLTERDRARDELLPQIEGDRRDDDSRRGR